MLEFFPGKTFLFLILMASGTAIITHVFGLTNDWPVLLAAIDGYVFGRLIESEKRKSEKK